MSSLTLTRFVPGATAASADQNANVAAWQAATAAGVIAVENIREEALDTPNITDHVVEAFGGTATLTSWFFELNGSIIADILVAPGIATINAAPIQIGPITIAAADDVLIRCSVWVHSPATVGGTQLKYILRRSSDGGATWTTITATRRPFSNFGDTVDMHRNYVVTHRHAGGAGTWYYQIYLEAIAAGSATAEAGVLYVQTIRS